MPAFSFEKLPPPVALESIPIVTVSVRQHRGIIVQMLDRLTEARMRRSAKTMMSDHSTDAVSKAALTKD
jgi:hypothetical protein